MSPTDQKKILALAAHPERSAATRFRLLALLPYLRARGLQVDFQPFLQSDHFDNFYEKGSRFDKSLRLANQSIKRLTLATTARDAQAAFIQREASLVGPAYTEFILSAFSGIPLVFDFDDAIWLHNVSQSTHPLAARLLKWPQKCWYTLRQAACVIAGSHYLAAQASTVNDNVHVVPTVVSATAWTPRPEKLEGSFTSPERPRIGWVGSHSTAHQLELVQSALYRLRENGHQFDVHVVGASAGFKLEGLEIQTEPWQLSKEIDTFRDIDIGLAPMHEGPIYEGKCGFKQLQYMAVGVPFVSSEIGGAREFVVHGENGLLARSSDDWYQHLEALLTTKELRAKLAQQGRHLVEDEYCIEVQGPRVAKLVETVTH